MMRGLSRFKRRSAFIRTRAASVWTDVGRLSTVVAMKRLPRGISIIAQLVPRQKSFISGRGIRRGHVFCHRRHQFHVVVVEDR
jgi:hypothetical protein